MNNNVYPLTASEPFPRRQWWMVAYSSEVTRQIIPRSLLGEKIVLYRTEEGQAIAASGVCPHRMYPLEKGRLVGNDIQCGYHGFKYDTKGVCTLTPSQSEPAPACLRSYPVVEHGGTVWVWSGEAHLADPALMPDLSALGVGNPVWKADVSPRVDLDGRYTLLIDNLVDLSHVSFIHTDTIPNGEAVAGIPYDLINTDKSVNVKRVGKFIPSNPFVKLLFPDYDGPVDQSFDAEYLGPNIIRTAGPMWKSGTGEHLGTLNFLHIMTPATATTTYYHVITTRDFGLENPAVSAMADHFARTIGPQDKDAIESIEAILRAGNIPREISCRADAGAIQVRRRLNAQIEAELAKPVAA
jgi:phenylpropionate dioxygenase-like ring-hydroxylating dioxygenase large terminal subunit